MVVAVICLIHFVACSYYKIVSAVAESCTARIKRNGCVAVFKLGRGNFAPVFVVLRNGKAGKAVVFTWIILTRKDKVGVTDCIESTENGKLHIDSFIRKAVEGVIIVFYKNAIPI